MKRLSFAFVFVLLVTGAFLREAASQPNLVTQIAPGVYHRAAERDKRIIANAGWVIFRDYVLVIDANYPWGARPILNDIRKTTSKPIKFVFDTHYHADHAWGNSVFVDAGATIVCSEECSEESRRKNTPAWANYKETGEYGLKGARLEHPQVAFHDKMVIDDGEHRVELTRMGPGHTLGDAVAWLPKERILFTGDLCVNFAGNNVADADADPDNWLRALDALAQKDVVRLIPGHGGQGTRETLRGQRAYLADMINGVREGLAGQKSADQVVKDLDVTRHDPWGKDKVRNETSIRAIYAKFSKQK